jgi:hypothetical protein
MQNELVLDVYKACYLWLEAPKWLVIKCGSTRQAPSGLGEKASFNADVAPVWLKRLVESERPELSTKCGQ